MIDNPEYQVEPRYLTAEQCAVRFAISLRHFKYLVEDGEMPQPIRFGSSVRWSVKTLEEFETEKMLEQLRPAARKKRCSPMRKK